MATTAGAIRPPRRLRARLVPALRRLHPGEGWSTLLLHVVAILAAASTVRRASWAPDPSDLALVVLGGFGLGFLLGKLRAPDLLAHLIALWGGLAVAVAISLDRLDAATDGRRERLRYLWDLALAWYRDALAGRRVDSEDLFIVLMALTIWLVAYTSAWTLFRRGWLTVALVLPGVIAVVNLGYAPADGTLPLLVFLIASCLLAARHHAFRREREWNRRGVPRPPRLPWRFLAAGANLALAAALLGWTLPLSARATLFDAVWTRIEGPIAAAEDRWDDLFDRWDGPRRSSGGSYAAFDDAFRLGGQLHLSNDPVMVLRNGTGVDDPPRPAYLAGQRYNRYNGRGWSTDHEDTFRQSDPDGARYSPQMAFRSGQAVLLSPEDLQRRSEVGAEITVLRPKGNLLFSTDTYQAVDRKANIQLSWRQLSDQPYDLTGENSRGVVSALPADLRPLARLLIDATFSAAATDGGASPPPREADIAAQVNRARAELRGRFLETRWDVGPAGRVTTLYATGQIPVYDDVEAVFSQAAVAPQSTYAVTSLASSAAPDDLRRAGDAYPPYVRDRYLALPDTVTARTEGLADQLAAGLANPFDIASAIEEHLRQRIAYEENIQAPPRGVDVVDHVLFETRQGYCEYYATSMAVLLRTLDIPARVVGGYFPVPYDPDLQGFRYTEKNAHLWVEVYFPGYGWIPFEPTAGRPDLSYGSDLAAPTDVVATPEPEPTAPPAEATPPPAPAEPAVPPPPPTSPSLLDRSPGRLGWASLIAGGAVLFGIAAVALVWLWGFRGLSPAGGFYARAVRAGRWLGVRPSPATTPVEYADRLGHAIPAARAPARAVADLYGQELYAGRTANPRAGRAAWGDLRRALVRSRLLGRKGGRRRV